MKGLVQAHIRWLSKEEGGRSSVPLILHHVIVCRFESNAITWPHEAWSLVVDFHTSPRTDKAVLADIRFLVSEGPSELLYSGSRFDLLDGYKVVAQGVVI